MNVPTHTCGCLTSLFPYIGPPQQPPDQLCPWRLVHHRREQAQEHARISSAEKGGPAEKEALNTFIELITISNLKALVAHPATGE